MNTPAHLILAAAVFARPSQTRWDPCWQMTAAALVGGFLPDFSLYFAAIWALFVMGVSPDVFFGVGYFLPGLQAIFAIDNSFVVWGGGLGLALLAKHRVWIAFTASGLLHIAFDFPLHHDDARAHFWPVTDWVFVSPVSYWDPDHFGWIAAPVEVLVCGVLLVMLWRRFKGRAARGVIALAGVAQVLPLVVWALIV